MLWTIVNHCVENYIENFKACWKPCQKFQSMLKHSFQNALQISTPAEIQFSTCITDFNMHVLKITVMWPLCNPFHQFWNIIAVIKIKSDIINEDYRSLWCYMWSVIEILCGLEEKIGPDCMQLLHNMHATENFKFNLAVNFLYFLSNWVNLLGIFTSCEKIRAFKRNPCFWNRYLMPWRWIIQLLWDFLKFFRSKYGRKWNTKRTSNNDLMYFYSFLKHQKGMNQKLR